MANQLTSSQFFLILCAGILPALIWLWFWLKEETRRPEPRGMILLSFFAGAFAILVVLPLQALAQKFFTPGLLLILSWATVEEAIKLMMAYFIAFRSPSYDEPIDAMVYLTTVALGFAAFENVLFLLNGIADGIAISIVTASMRFIGATLLHVFSSATLGGIIAMSFCKSRPKKVAYAIVGLITASVLHTLFNLFIINPEWLGESVNILTVFATLWLGIIALLLFFEKIKSVTCNIKQII